MKPYPQLQFGLLAISILALVATAGALFGDHSQFARVLTVLAGLLLLSVALILSGSMARANRKAEAERGRLATVGATGVESLARSVEAIQMKDEFLAVVVHELRDPLSPILIWSQLLRSGTLDPARTQLALQAIERGVATQTRLLAELLDLSLASSGELRLDLNPVDLAPMVHRALAAQRAASETKRLRLQVAVDESASQVLGDADRLQQSISNLIANAIDSSLEGGEVTVKLEGADSQIEITVNHASEDMSADMVSHAFDLHPRDADVWVQNRGRLALGLMAARHFVRLHGGEIVARSDGPGRGSSFALRIPVRLESDVASSRPASI